MCQLVCQMFVSRCKADVAGFWVKSEQCWVPLRAAGSSQNSAGCCVGCCCVAVITLVFTFAYYALWLWFWKSCQQYVGSTLTHMFARLLPCTSVGLLHLIMGALPCCAGFALCERTCVLSLQERQGRTWICVSGEPPYNVERLHASTLVPTTCLRGSNGKTRQLFRPSHSLAVVTPHSLNNNCASGLNPTSHCASQPHSTHTSLGCCHRPTSLTHCVSPAPAQRHSPGTAPSSHPQQTGQTQGGAAAGTRSTAAGTAAARTWAAQAQPRG